ncbi:MAG: hypothetical protein NTY86_00240 [Deltaproteobacteria bacterium]|nr:hypothetical protein [Deltaproteobacteria bacterium]
MKLTIYRKLLLSYLAMALLTVLASAYAIFSLQQLNDLAYRIINEDFTIVEQSKSLLDSLIAQESAEKRYLILQDPTIEEIFWSRSREFSRLVGEMQKSRFAGIGPTIASSMASTTNFSPWRFNWSVRNGTKRPRRFPKGRGGRRSTRWPCFSARYRRRRKGISMSG